MYFQIYLLYNNKRLTKCLGILKRGNNYINKAIGSFKPGIIPIYYIYRS